MAIEIVAIGTSLGGLKALQTVLSSLPRDVGASVVIAQHRRPEGSPLVSLLTTVCPMPVVEPDDKQKLEKNVVYVAPPDYHMLVERDYLSLSVDEPVEHARPSIDVLFDSVAEAFGERSIGVLLTGSNEDGARGLARIARRGGVTIVEDPATAESPIAPGAALARTKVDHVAHLASIAAIILSSCRASASKSFRTGERP